MAQRVGFFGPFGTFTEQALKTLADLAGSEHVPYRTVPDVLDAVESGDVDFGLVPIENSIEGMVNFTQDALAFDHELLIVREVVIDIEHCLLARPGVSGVGVETDGQGRPSLVVHLDSDRPDVRDGLPDQLEGYPVRYLVTGPFKAY